ncbi:Zinc finger CCCH domain-containing protein 44 [Striga hermonthica]|uniref:Zinc finger CCCH domain-containing protein 44 n=1 Tax=Striga hermonthica TaxID=68872 RepID=A0A9N7NP67_STRHE|nr:Zinc finger CCCH domain-containing protein 44 [Striga hermonthica]
MENIETLLAAVAQTQGLEDDGPAVKTGVERGPENSEAPSVDVPAPARALAPAPPAAGQVIDAAVDKKKKRGWPKGQTRAKPPPRKRIKPENEEDVCFICFDGGSLVLCDRKGCPKAYHPACIKRDEAFFQSKAKWNCGWHICSVCRKTSHYLCYTCTYSLCKGCTKDADYVCVRGNKGFCTICMKTIMLIENKDQANTESVDFDDQTSWEYLFKVYWVILKEKFSLTLDELIRAKNPCKSVPAETALLSTGFDVKKTDNDNIIGVITPGHDKDTTKPIAYEINNETSTWKDSEWATKDLLECVSLMKKGEKSVISEFDVQTLLLDYIKKNNLRDPHRKSQIVCDQSLRNLFGKPSVGHIEMLKLLELHFIPPGLVSSRTISRKQKTSSKKCEERAPQQNNDSNEYCAAIDVHNINLIYLRRNVLEKLIDDRESFESKVIGSIVRIKISSDDQKLEVLHRLVQVVGTSKVLGEPYSVGSRTKDFMLEVLNLDKKEVVSIDAVSNQEFTEEECKRLRQSMKCGLVKHFTVGEIQNKAMALQPVRVDDMLKLPEERSRRISEIPEVHLDLKMNPNYESEKDTKSAGVSKADENVRPSDSDLPPQNERKKPISSNKKDKEERIVRTRNRVRKKIKSGESSGIKKDQALQSSVLETSLAIASVENSQPTSIMETENLWHYRDPNSKIQGPFSMIQLRKWSTTGLFPPDMRIWTNHEQYDSLLLTDCLAGKFHLALDTSHSGTQNEEEVPAEEIRVLSEGTNVNSGDSNQTKPGLASNTGLTSKKNAEPVKEDASAAERNPAVAAVCYIISFLSRFDS